MSAPAVDPIAPSGNPLANQPANQPNTNMQAPNSFAQAARAGAGTAASEPKGATIAISKTVLAAARAVDGTFPAIYNIRKVPDNVADIAPGEPLGFYAAQNYESVAAMIADEPRSANRAAVFKSSKIYFIKILGSTPLIVLTGLTPQAGQASKAEARTIFVDATAGSCTQEIALEDVGLAALGAEPTTTVTTPAEHTAKVFGNNFSKKRGPFSVGEVPASTANRIVGAHPAITVQMPMQRVITTKSANANATLKFAYGTDPSVIFQVAKGIRDDFYAMPRLGAIRISRKTGDISDDDITKIRATHPEVTACILDVRRPKPASDSGVDRRTPQQIQRDMTTDMIVVRTASAIPLSFELLSALAARWKGSLIRGDASSALMRVPKGVIPTGSVRVGSLLVATLLDELRESRAAGASEGTAAQNSEEADDALPPIPAEGAAAALQNGPQSSEDTSSQHAAAAAAAAAAANSEEQLAFENGPPKLDGESGEGLNLDSIHPSKIDFQDGEEDVERIAPSAESRGTRKRANRDDQGDGDERGMTK
jgi:hypothetical protein